MNMIMGAIFIFQVVNIEVFFELFKVKLCKTSALSHAFILLINCWHFNIYEQNRFKAQLS